MNIMASDIQTRQLKLAPEWPHWRGLQPPHQFAVEVRALCRILRVKPVPGMFENPPDGLGTITGSVIATIGWRYGE